MKKLLFVSALTLSAQLMFAQTSTLSVEKIMKDPKWIGYSPSGLSWTNNGLLTFSWNAENFPGDSTYYVDTKSFQPQKANVYQRQDFLNAQQVQYNQAGTQFIYLKNGNIVLGEKKSGKTTFVTQIVDQVSNIRFTHNDTKITYQYGQNLYSWEIATGITTQLTNFSSGGNVEVPGRGGMPARQNTGNAAKANEQEEWVSKDALRLSEVLQERKANKEATAEARKSYPKAETLRNISTQGKMLSAVSVSNTGKYVSYRLTQSATNKNTLVPDYVTESGYVSNLNGRPKVGTIPSTSEFYIWNTELDSIIVFPVKDLPGITELPDYVKDYPEKYAKDLKTPPTRLVNVQSIVWSTQGNKAIIEIRSVDNKDRWLVLFEDGVFKNIDRQRDEAWIAGPGISGFGGRHIGFLDDNTIYFQSETTGYSHLYTYDIAGNRKKPLTQGKYEVLNAQLSKDKKHFYITTNEIHPGEQHLYKLEISSGKQTKLTSMTGAHQASISPDEKWIAYTYSYSTKPWELYIQENKPGAVPKQITHLAQTADFKSYQWRDPEVVTIKANDGEMIYGRLYTPKNAHSSKPAVIFVHGAGYLQNAHKWWSSYFREYMFHNLLADLGYTVLDIDYRGSAGYGRNWRTGIYRHMGGKDLSDHVDAANWLVKEKGVNAKNIGIYGGSYGGFITLMALFNEPETFKSGAALRSVTDWAHYNHGYTANILNEPHKDSLSYAKSSPINFAEGLKGYLLMCHGMVDVNVQFQDIVRLSQRLIELGKDNWELAVYPMEDHGFVEPSSWTDEYKRILKLFETTLKQ
jgi:dipeptidyl aminopeptidase/acylaminoacyl peptidase